MNEKRKKKLIKKYDGKREREQIRIKEKKRGEIIKNR